MIQIDNVSYNAEWVASSIEQTADILNGDNSGRLQGTKSMYLEYIGTFFNLSGKIHRGAACTDTEWDNLYLVLANPINNHTVKIPFNQGSMTTEVYISSIKRKLVKKTPDANKWDSVYDVAYVSINSQWLAGGSLNGYAEGLM